MPREVEGEVEGEGEGGRRRRCSYVYVVRDGRDAAASFYHHLSSQAPEDGGYVGGWDAFFDEWIGGEARDCFPSSNISLVRLAT